MDELDHRRRTDALKAPPLGRAGASSRSGPALVLGPTAARPVALRHSGPGPHAQFGADDFVGVADLPRRLLQRRLLHLDSGAK